MIVIAILILFSAWNPTPVGRFVRGTFHTVFLPVEKAFSSIAFGMRDIGDFLSSIGDLNRENERLSGENARLAAENASLGFLRAENEELRRAVGIAPRDRFDLLPSQAVAHGTDGGAVLIDKGSMQGVRTGMPVLSFSGSFVGTVGEVYPASSRIAFITGSDSAVGGVTVENGTKGVIQGGRGLGVAFSMTLRSDPLSVGDRVVTSGSGEGIPSGLFVGTVASVQDTEDRLFRDATLSLPDDLERLRFLFVIRNGDDV